MDKINRYDDGPYHWFLPYFFARRYERPLALIHDLLPSSGRILDIGCGDGRLTDQVAGRTGAMVTGLDNQELPLQFARRLVKHQNIEFCNGDAIVLPFRDQVFAAAVCFDVIEHIPPEKLAGLMKDVQRVLRLDGLVVITTPNRDSLDNRLWGHRPNAKHYYEYNLPELEAILCAHGFTLERKAGIYLPPPIFRRYLEHYASLFPMKHVFRALIRAGTRLPKWSVTLLIAARM